ncbi:DUF177 domain-containing protein [Candidatus Bipolaricaulota bacterium]|nr:DUF177 domain-containing protein [Candidatus Bipolaricaulota bacterium]
MKLDLEAMRAAPGRPFAVSGEEDIPTLDWRGESLLVEGAVHADAVAFYQEERVVLRVRVQGRVHRPCSRCLVDLVEPVNYEDSLEVMPDELVGSYLELRPMIEAGMRIGLSLKPLCRPDCRGLCPTCGADLNREGHRPGCGTKETRDPRLAKLKELL